MRRWSVVKANTTVFALLMMASTIAIAPGCDDAEGKPKTASQPVDVPIAPEHLVEEGSKIFATNCIGCHGPAGEGRVGMGPRLASESFLAAASDEMLLTTISKGRMGTTMAAWGSMLPASQVQALAAYVRSLTPHQPATLDESPLRGEIAAGEDLFKSICAACHGRNGGGYMEASSGTGIGRKVFLDTVSDGFLRYIIKNGKTQTPMKSFREDEPMAVANLTDDQIEDVIAFMRSNAW